MGPTTEREVKLRPGPRFERLGIGGRDLDDRILQSDYFDTDDMRLAAAAVTLRRRRSGDDESAVWQLKLPRNGPDRLEVEWPATGEGIPSEIAETLIAHTRGRPLVETAALRTHRSGVRVTRKGRAIAEVVHDDVEVLGEDGMIRGFEELEIELVDGTAKDLQRLERRLRKAGAIDPDGRPKLMQALDFTPRREPQFRARTSGDQLVLALRRQYEEILEHDPGTRLGTDPEELHDHRVAIRRARAFLRVGRPFLDRQWADGLRAALRPAGRSLSQVRDLDVLIEELESEAPRLDEVERPGAADVVQLLRDRRGNEQAAMRAALSDPAYISALNRFEVALENPMVTGDGSLGRVVRKEHRRARRLVRRAKKAPSDSELHEIRKAVKRARYAAELADQAGVSGAGRYVKRAKVVQDVLGDHQDAVVAAATLEEIEPELRRPIARLAASSLREQQRRRKDASRAVFPKRWHKLEAAAESFG
jgi:CHAD domain-containing protein